LYFITLCTANRENNLGNIVNGEMVLSPIGAIVKEEWEKSFVLRKELFCDVYVIMPNHIHAILWIDQNGETGVKTGNICDFGDVENDGNDGNDGNVKTHGHVETHGRASLQIPEQTQPPFDNSVKNNYGIAVRVPKSISSFVEGFKSSSTKQINQFRQTPKSPVWQTRFHDHIIRDEKSYHTIFSYIETNPERWDEDSLFSE
jgi:REP element-mobilizing transposase RayT